MCAKKQKSCNNCKAFLGVRNVLDKSCALEYSTVQDIGVVFPAEDCPKPNRLYDLADCYDKIGKPGTAWVTRIEAKKYS